jgi:hypothetical protein
MVNRLALPSEGLILPPGSTFWFEPKAYIEQKESWYIALHGGNK